MTAQAVTLRPAVPADAPTLARLAQRDCAAVPAEPILLAEVAGTVRAARSVATGAAIADPFAPSAHLLALLALHASTATRPLPTPRHRVRRRRLVPARTLAPLPGR